MHQQAETAQQAAVVAEPHGVEGIAPAISMLLLCCKLNVF